MNRGYVLTLIGMLMVLDCCAGQTNGVPTQAPQIRINFVKDAELDSVEITQLLQLARQNGIRNPAEVATFYYLPTGGRGISVKSRERIDGRNVYYDTICLSKVGWDDFKPGKKNKTIGSFSVEYPKFTTHLRTYEVNKQTIRISIGEGIDTALADKVIQPILSKSVQIEKGAASDFELAKQVGLQNAGLLSEIEQMLKESPDGIGLSMPRKGQFELQFPKSMKILMFNLEKGEVVITGIAHYVI